MHEIEKLLIHHRVKNGLKNYLFESREKEIQQFSETKTDFVNPVYLYKTIDKLIDENSILVADGGDFVGTASYTVRPRAALGWLDPGPLEHWE